MKIDSQSLSLVLAGICVLGALLSLVASFGFFRAKSDQPAFSKFVGNLSTLVLFLGTALGIWILGLRYVEVNHFPSQTMSEVITYFCVAMLFSGCVLHWVLRWERYGTAARGLGYLLQALTMGGVVATLYYVQTMPTTERDLPPALQSYWFAPHITALIFSYGTLGIAAILAFLYFGFSLMKGLTRGGLTGLSITGTLAFILLTPFVHFIAIPIFFLCIVPIGIYLHKSGKGFDWLPNWERNLDEMSFRVFAVGFPFLTAGLMMGALWAQEAWANYWGWDSKEVTALITWFIYLIYLHLRFIAGWRGAKSMKVLLVGAVSIFLTFQLFGYLPDSQKSLHRYTDPDVPAQEGMQGGAPGR